MSKYFEIHGNKIVAKDGLIVSIDKFPADAVSCDILDRIYDMGLAQGREEAIEALRILKEVKEQR